MRVFSTEAQQGAMACSRLPYTYYITATSLTMQVQGQMMSTELGFF